MNVASILLVTCLLGLCHCRRSKLPTDGLFIEVLDDYAEDEIVTSNFVEETRKRGSNDKRLVWDMAHGTAYEVEYTLSSARRSNAGKVEDVAVEDSRRLPYSRHTTNPITLNLSEPDPSICGAIRTDVDGIPAVVYLLKSSQINKIVNGDKKVWIASKMKVGTDLPTKFALDLSSLKEDDEKYQLVKCGKDDVNRLVTPHPGNLIERIIDGNLEVWTASDGHVCYLCEYYPKDDSGEIKLHVRKNEDLLSFSRFEKVGEWKKR
ncbi:signal peptide containing protein [Theileria equi strain WA]|uniref:Signal peptide containing protein n=1 Tax=Theileria equi strain WA TaxID=1537102 RepID=L1LAP2_THEEQ|nr:signal peptide containing protein [Theileria equi strain WA]EKX72314.1 signal peptide containing protein [Theileria equi strain WA]|eukprot:XP_004831766.1 signal peptide containing protein [Theileria equi strain WA]